MGGKCPHRSVKKRRYSHNDHATTPFTMSFRKGRKRESPCPWMKIFREWGSTIVFTAIAILLMWLSETNISRPNGIGSVLSFRIVRMKRVYAELELQPSREKEILQPGVKIMLGPAPHTQLDADLAAGMGKPDNGPKLMAM
ncbi:hypothetical protein SASPL_105616 [Salvia splendens]|uniref:Uncharacterized protein n=1 Tax=Salvia splendens TaxID=180675 RepID=A0A8X9A8U6_SALSN|nr:hypothetical protein SASPL_105616 [Salvia splendens]